MLLQIDLKEYKNINNKDHKGVSNKKCYLTFSPLTMHLKTKIPHRFTMNLNTYLYILEYNLWSSPFSCFMLPDGFVYKTYETALFIKRSGIRVTG